MTRSEKFAHLLRLGILLALCVALVRAGVAFWNLMQTHGLSLERYFYLPVAFLLGAALAVRSIVRTVRILRAGGAVPGRRGRGAGTVDPAADSDKGEA